MKIQVLPAAFEQQPVLANLLELYAHDFSGFYPIEIGEDGRFGYPALPLYWNERDRRPFLIRVEGKLAGFALVVKTDAAWDMAEFFILRGYRRNRVGTRVAHAVWKQFPGAWQIRVMHANASARQFWSQAIAEFTGEPAEPVQVERGGNLWDHFAFVS